MAPGTAALLVVALANAVPTASVGKDDGFRNAIKQARLALHQGKSK